MVVEIPLNCCNPRLELCFMGVAAAGATRSSGGQSLQLQQTPDLSCLWCLITPHNTAPLMS